MNRLYYGDNLDVLRKQIADANVDMIYLDPPFNSNASYNVLFKGPTGGESARLPARRDDAFRKAPKEAPRGAQGALDL